MERCLIATFDYSYWLLTSLFSLSQELADLIRSSRDFMSSIAKAKTAKLSKSS